MIDNFIYLILFFLISDDYDDDPFDVKVSHETFHI